MTDRIVFYIFLKNIEFILYKSDKNERKLQRLYYKVKKLSYFGDSRSSFENPTDNQRTEPHCCSCQLVGKMRLWQ